MIKIIDSFMLYNEIDLLLYRLSILNKYVNKFIIVESTLTFSGKSKSLYFKENEDKFSQFLDKIIYIVVDDMPYKNPNFERNEQWQNEYHQRNCIKRGLDQIINNLDDFDILLTSDLDEIPDPQILENAIKNELEYDKNNLNRLGLDMYYYNLNTKIGDQVWHGIKLMNILTYKNLGLTFQNMRLWEHSNYVPIIKNGGWHLSYFGDVDFIIKKVESYSHQEYNNNNYLDKEILKDKIKNNVNFIGGMEPKFIKIKDNVNLPVEYDKYLYKYIIE